MKFSKGPRAREAFSSLEVLIVIVTVILLVVVFAMIQPIGSNRARAQRINCVSNLKSTGMAARMWSNDHEEHFPWTLSTNKEGTMEFAASAEVFRHFMVLTTELASPKVLVCASDRERRRSSTFSVPLANSNLSYFIGLDADETRPQTILGGDRNAIGGVTNGAWLVFRATNAPGWTRDIHHLEGNLGLGDGSVQQMTTISLARQFQAALTSQSNPVIHLAIPRTPEDRSLDHRFVGVSPAQLIGVTVALAAIALWIVIRRGLLAAAAEPPCDP